MMPYMRPDLWYQGQTIHACMLQQPSLVDKLLLLEDLCPVQTASHTIGR